MAVVVSVESQTSAVRQASRSVLRVRLVGDLQVERGGVSAVLPASKRTRALLGFLAATHKPQSRQSLCDLFWDGPDDPRGALRWSLTKLRPVVNHAGNDRLVADRLHVEFRPQAAEVDTARISSLLAGGIEAARMPALEEAAELLQGEFLDGLDLPACYRFHNWCMAERERLGGLRSAVLSQLLLRLDGDPTKALPFARALIATDPLSETAHAKLTSLLIGLGRPREALAHAEEAGALLERELAAPPTGELRRAINLARPSPSSQVRVASSEPSDAGPRAGRPAAKRTPPLDHGGAQVIITKALEGLATAAEQQLLLLLGEPGMGKTRWLEDLDARAKSAGYRVLSARAFEAEMVRPYGTWVDLLGGLTDKDLPETARRDIAALLLNNEGGSAQGDRASLFAGVGTVLRQLSLSQPLVVIFDDLQWLDDASCSMLHYQVRTLRSAARVLFVAAARTGELDDNASVKRLVQSLQREKFMHQWRLSPLDLAATAALLEDAGSRLDPAMVLRQSAGNPLFALELARAHGRGEAVESSSLTGLIAIELARLPGPERDALTFAATMGRDFAPDLLCLAMDLPELEVLTRVEHLELRGLLRASGAGHYDFVHDLFRQATYRSLTQPMRRIVHRQIARAFTAKAAGEEDLQSELAHHASLAGDHLMAVRALVTVGERALRVFAPGDAAAAAERALRSLAEIPAGPEHIRLQMALLDVRIHATMGPQAPRLPSLEAELKLVTQAAAAAGLHAEAANGFVLLSFLAQQSDALSKARDATLLATKYGRAADDTTRCQQLANTARCLMDVEKNIPEVRELIVDAEALSNSLSLRITELEWAQGLLARWDGDVPEAHQRMIDALELARLRKERWREFELLIWLATVEFELGLYREVAFRCDEISSFAQKMGEDRAPAADALSALAAMARDPSMSREGLAAAMAELRAVDDKTHLAYVLNEAALAFMSVGNQRECKALAEQARCTAEAINHTTEIAVARATLARLANAAGDDAQAAELMAPYQAPDMDVSSLSSRARHHLALAATASGLPIPTLVPTLNV